MKIYNKDNALGRLSANKLMLHWVNREIEKCKQRNPTPNTPAQIALGGRLKSLYNTRSKLESNILKNREKLND